MQYWCAILHWPVSGSRGVGFPVAKEKEEKTIFDQWCPRIASCFLCAMSVSVQKTRVSIAVKEYRSVQETTLGLAAIKMWQRKQLQRALAAIRDDQPNIPNAKRLWYRYLLDYILTILVIKNANCLHLSGYVCCCIVWGEYCDIVFLFRHFRTDFFNLRHGARRSLKS